MKIAIQSIKKALPAKLAFLALILLVSCQDDEAAMEPKLLLGTGTLQVANTANEHTVELLSNLPWTVAADVDWITFTQTEGDKGKGLLRFSVAENDDDERTGSITVSLSDDVVKEVRVIQEAGNRDDIYVKSGGTGDGYSWEEATSLENALDIAVSGNTIHIAAGTYLPANPVTGGDPADQGDLTFEMRKYIRLKGGYPADAAEGAEADPASHKTILSGDGSSYHVVTVTAPRSEGQKVVLEGLTISHGKASGTASSVAINGVDFRRDYGGGVIIGNATVDILDTDIVDNSSDKFVAGLYAFGESVVTIKRSRVNNNISAGNGGGAWINSSTAYVSDSEFNANEASGTAPGFHGYPDAEIYMFNSSVSHNKGTSYGAGFYIRENTTAVLVNCLINGNTSTATHGGGGIMMYNNNTLSLISSTVTGNNIAGPGGGIYRRSGVNTVSVYNSIISGNVQKDDGPDVDVYETDAPAVVVESSVTGEKVYDRNGGEIAATFDFNTMLSPEYLPIGDSNPARDHGMTASALSDLAGTFEPVIEQDIITADFHGNSRSEVSIMGALVR